jgi:hypothetical protein
MMRKILRELRREFPRCAIEVTNGNHFRLVLPNGRAVYAPSTPSDNRRGLRNTRAAVRRALRASDNATAGDCHHDR